MTAARKVYGSGNVVLQRLRYFFFYPARTRGEYAFVALRVVVAYLWLDTVIPRWASLAAGHPETNSVAGRFFGADYALVGTYVVTVFETLAALALLFGFLTRLGALWGTIEFSITGAFGWLSPAGPTHITGAFGLLKDFGLMAACLTLLLNGSLALSLDGFFARRWKRSAQRAPSETAMKSV